MRVAFAGTPEFAAQALEAIVAAGHTVPLVLTQPDRPSGRGMKLTPGRVKQVALAHGIAVDQPANLKTDASRAALAAAAPDVLVVAAYGLILPRPVLELPRFGCLNIHASLLPRWRGAAPIQRAIAAGDRETGITIMQMDPGLDTGPMLLCGRTDIAADDTAATLHDRLAGLGASLIVEALRALEQGRLAPVAQPEAGVTYAAKIDKAEARLDLGRDAESLARQVRAFDPFPGCYIDCGGTQIKVWRAAACPGRGAPGEVLSRAADGIEVACGEGVLKLLELQKPGGKRLPVRDFLAGADFPDTIRP